MSRSNAAEEIKSRLNLVDVIGGYVRLNRAGREYRGLCPFHTEHTASFYVSPEKQVWSCHGCHEGGDLFTFIEKIEHTDFRGALEELARRAGVDLEADSPSSAAEARQRHLREEALRLNQLAIDFYHEVLMRHPAGAAGRGLLDQRQVGDQDRVEFKLGYAPAGSSQDNLVRFLRRHKAQDSDIVASGLARSGRGQLQDFFRQRLLVPIRDERGRPVGFGGRALGSEGPKYLNTRTTALFDKSGVLFGLDRAREAISKERRAVLMEGYFDVIGAHRSGVRTAISTSGTALTEVQVRLLRRFADEVILCFDGDGAGRRASQAAVGLLVGSGMRCRLLSLPDGEDPDDLSRRDPGALEQLVRDAPPVWEVLVDLALGNASATSTADRQAALGRVMPVLARIPEASIRALYAERAGRRLGIDTGRILEDVERGGRRPSGRSTTGSLAVSGRGNSAMGASAHLLGLLRLRPQLIPEVRDHYQVVRGDFADPEQGSLYQALLDCYPERLDLEGVAPEVRRVAESLPDQEFPELDPEAGDPRLRRAVEDCVRATRIEGLERRVSAITQRMVGLSHHRQGDGPELVAEMDRLRRQIEGLRRSGVEA